MNESTKNLLESLNHRFGDRVAISPSPQGILTLEIAVSAWLEVCRALRDEEDFAFDS